MQIVIFTAILTISCFFCSAYGDCINGDLKCNGEINCSNGSDKDSKVCPESTWILSVPAPKSTSNVTLKSTPTVTPISISTPSPFLPIIPNPSKESCTAPPQPRNGHWKLHRSQCLSGQDCDIQEGVELTLGSHLIYSCDPGYKIRGSFDVSCISGGRWLNIPICIAIRCKVLNTASLNAVCIYNNEQISCNSPALPRTRAQLFCQQGYLSANNILSRQRKDVICNAQGQWEPEPIQCIPACGTLPTDVTPLILGTSRPNITEFPWHASMYRDFTNKPKQYFCGATIIQENLLITAAHCVYDESNKQVINASEIYVVTGNIYRDYDIPFHDPRIVRKNQVKKIYVRCQYLGLIGNYLGDIAILELVQPFVFSNWLVPACLDVDTYGDQIVRELGAYGKIAGFGRTALSYSNAILQALYVQYVPFNQCRSASQNAKTEQFITIDKFCTGYMNDSSICDGDSGSGLVFKTGELWYLRGIVSVSLGKILHDESTRCDNVYTLYTRVSSYISWIQDIILKIEENKPYSQC